MRGLRFISIALASMHLAFIGCATSDCRLTPKNVRLVDLRIPDIGTKADWIILTEGEETIESGILVKEEIDGILSYYWKGPNREITSVYDLKTMNWMGKWSHKNKEWTRRATPHIGNKLFPLWAGKVFTSPFSYESKSGRSAQIKSLVTVEGWETVTVPAGTFETLRIFQEGPNFSVTYWYAPKIGMDVKFESSNIEGERSWKLMKIIEP